MQAKFNGLIAEILEKQPEGLVVFLEQNLKLPTFKAQELAARIERDYCAKFTVLQKTITADPSCNLPSESKANSYAVDIFSAKEFERFIKWLLGELGFEVHPAKYASDSGVDLVVSKDSEKILVQAKRYPKGTYVSNSVLLNAQNAMAVYGCKRAIVVTNSYFSKQAAVTAKKLNLELWDKEALSAKIDEAKNAVTADVLSVFPKYKGSLLQSLIALEETNDFILERRANGKYDVHLPGVKYPVLSFHARYEDVVRCVFRIKNNEPIGEYDGFALIRSDRNERYGPDGERAYALILKYLEQFLE